MKIEHKAFPFYEFAGTEREIGRQIGEEMRDQIRTVIPYWFDVLSTIFPDKLEDMIKVCKKFEQPAKDYAPELWEEIEGIAEGANMTTDEILFIQGGWELDSCGFWLHRFCLLRQSYQRRQDHPGPELRLVSQCSHHR